MDKLVLEYEIFAIIVFLFIDDLGIPLPGATIVFTAAVLAKTTPEISIYSIFLIAIFIPPIANSILFFWGKDGARKWLKTHGHKIFLPDDRLKKADIFFKKHGEKTVFFAAMLSSVRAVTSIIAGSFNMHPVKFLMYHWAGVFVWASVLVGMGHFFGEAIWEILKRDLKLFLLLAFCLILANMAWDKYKKIIFKK